MLKEPAATWNVAGEAAKPPRALASAAATVVVGATKAHIFASKERAEWERSAKAKAVESLRRKGYGTGG